MSRATRIVVMLGGLAVATACLTALWWAMRAVMGVGGFCAEGGPYQIQTHCPAGTMPIMFLAIPLGIVAVGVYAWANAPLPGPHLEMVAWSALFLSLGWNFLEFAFWPPPQLDASSGDAWGWIICGVIFVAMGAVPLIGILLGARSRRSVFWADADEARRGPRVRRSMRAGDASAAADLLMDLSHDGELDANDLEAVRDVLSPPIEQLAPEQGDPNSSKGALAVLQVLAIALGIIVGTWWGSGSLG